MSIQEMKSKIHQLVDEVDDETVLETVSQILSAAPEYDILDDLTDDQLAGLEEAREDARQGKGTLLADFKRKMEEKWPQSK